MLILRTAGSCERLCIKNERKQCSKIIFSVTLKKTNNLPNCTVCLLAFQWKIWHLHQWHLLLLLFLLLYPLYFGICTVKKKTNLKPKSSVFLAYCTESEYAMAVLKMTATYLQQLLFSCSLKLSIPEALFKIWKEKGILQYPCQSRCFSWFHRVLIEETLKPSSLLNFFFC